MCLQGSESAGKHSALTLEITSYVQARSSHILESRQFLIDRCLKTHSLLICFHHWKNIAFPAFCLLRITHCLKMLAWRYFSVTISPDCVTIGKVPTLTGKKTNIQTSVPNITFFFFFFCRRDPVILGLSGNFLDTTGTHPECEPAYRTLVVKFAFFSWQSKVILVGTLGISIEFCSGRVLLLSFKSGVYQNGLCNWSIADYLTTPHHFDFRC